ncbi:MAG: NosD domain-containing protein [Promethearchaeota archaeon]
MKKTLVLYFKIIIIIVTLTIVTLLSASSSTDLRSYKIDFTTNNVISINNNSEFEYLAEQEGWIGNGTPSNPYSIINLTINASGRRIIDINNVDLHFQIKNCTLIGAGVSFFNVKNGMLINNSIIDEPEKRGIYIDHCVNFMIKKNFFSRITLINVEKGEISNNSIIDGGYGINLDNCSDIQIEFNEITDSINTEGISIKASSEITISRNKISSCNNGITSEHSSDLMITNNRIYGIENNGILFQHTSQSNIEENNVSYAFFGIVVSESDNNDIVNNSVGFIRSDCIYIEMSNQNTISMNELFGSQPWFVAEGIALSNSQNNICIDNFIHKCWIGIYLDYSSKNKILKNIIMDSYDDGMWVHLSSDENEVSENRIYRSHYGIFLAECNGNAIQNNEICDNLLGIYLTKAHYNSIIGNNISDNHQGGIRLQSSNYNEITGNWFQLNRGKDFYQNDSTGNILESKYLVDTHNEPAPGWMYPILLISFSVTTVIRRRKRV